MQKLLEASERDRGEHMRKKRNRLGRKKENRSLPVVTSEVTTLKSFLLLVEGSTCPFLYDTLLNLSPRSSRLFYQQTTTKNSK